jgi:hypothetical protein
MHQGHFNVNRRAAFQQYGTVPADLAIKVRNDCSCYLSSFEVSDTYMLDSI